jgi:multicomponent Na+:H+ antiporter subunit G
MAVSTATNILLCIAVLAAWLSASSFLRLRTPLERLHVVTFVNVVSIGALTIAGFTSEGVTSRTMKLIFLWVVNLLIGALLSHATARALHLRGGEMR